MENTSPTATLENTSPGAGPHTRKNPLKRRASSRPRVSGIRKADKKRILPPSSEPKFPSPITERVLQRETYRREQERRRERNRSRLRESLDPRNHAPHRKPFEPRDGGHGLARLNADVMAALGRMAPPGEKRERAVEELTEELEELRIPDPLTVRARAWSCALIGGRGRGGTGDGAVGDGAAGEESAGDECAIEDEPVDESAIEDETA